MSEKVFVEKKCYDVYEWQGECPACHAPQSASRRELVDLLCIECVRKTAFESVLKDVKVGAPFNRKWTGSVVIGSSNNARGDMLLILHPDMTVTKLTKSCGSWYESLREPADKYIRTTTRCVLFDPQEVDPEPHTNWVERLLGLFRRK